MTQTMSIDATAPSSMPGSAWCFLRKAVQVVRWLAGTALVASLAACGGGSDSGGGGGGSNPFAGTYNGIGTLTLSAPGVAPQTATGTIQFVIDPQGNVTSDPGTDFSGTGKLNGNTFVIVLGPEQLQPDGMSCAGTVSLTGTVDGNTITGQFSSTGFTCNGVPITWTGTFSATRAAGAAVMLPGDPVMEAARGAIRSTR